MLGNHSTCRFLLRWFLYLINLADLSIVILPGGNGVIPITVVEHLELEKLPASLVQHVQLSLPFLDDRLQNPRSVKGSRGLLHVRAEVGVLLEHVVVQVALLQAVAARVLLRLVYEVALLVVRHIEVADDLRARLTLAHLERPVPYWIFLAAIAYTYLTVKYQVHLVDHVELVVDYAVFLCGEESPRHEPLRYHEH